MVSHLSVALAQLTPVWLNKSATLKKVEDAIREAASKNAELIVFGEGFVPGYPYWLALTEASKWNDPIQKEIYAHYARNAVQIEAGELESVCKLAKQYNIAMYLGINERAANRGGHSLYCSLVYINQHGEIKSVHRKLQPTYDERLVWSPGDGNGLQVHPLKSFTVGGLNCWENWMPLPRTALYGLGEDLHIAVWPGSVHNTKDITRFIARESRSFVVSVSTLMRKSDIPLDAPYRELYVEKADEYVSNGGSCIAGPDGEWIVESIGFTEGIFVHELDWNRVLEERQNFDPVGHYSRPDVTKLTVNRERQSTVDYR